MIRELLSNNRIPWPGLLALALILLGQSTVFAQSPNPSNRHRIEKWELLEEDFTMGIVKNEAHADHLRDYDSAVLGRGWIPVKYTPAINDLYCPHPSPTACSVNCGKYSTGCNHPKLTECNDRCKSVEWRQWTYRAALFETAEEAQKEEHHFLEIKEWEGAYIEVFVNARPVKNVNPLLSSFATVTIDLDGLIRLDGKDSIYIVFSSPTQLGKIYSQRSGMTFPADNEAEITTFGSYGYNPQSGIAAKASPFLRKPIVQYGWDIAPRRVLVGLGEGVSVHGWSDNYLQKLDISQDSTRQRLDERGRPTEYVYGHVDLYYLCDTMRGLPSFVRITSGNLEDLHDDIEWDLVQMTNPWNAVSDSEVEDVTMSVNGFGVEGRHRRMRFRMKNPKRWYPNGLYQQVYNDSYPALYHIEISAHQLDKNGRNQIHGIEKDWGVRTIALDTSGGRFAFSVNGISVFAQGANLIWARQFGDSASLYPERLFLGDPGLMGELEVMRWQGYNMVRVWGGGAYPSEAFYDRCDALGIMVWQDLMFNGTMYPDDLGHFVSKSSSIFGGSQKESSGQNQLFSDAVSSEIHAQAMRLHSHPSLALWCGNNEIEVAWQNWDWQQKYNIHGADSVRQWKAYLSLFDTLIPEILSAWDAGIPYTRSSPVGNWGNLQQMKSGDNHDWSIWHGERGFAHLDSARMPFCSEYGLPSPSHEKPSNFAEYVEPFDGARSDWKSRLLSYKGPKLLERYVREEYPKIWPHLNNAEFWPPHRGIESVGFMDFSDSAAVVQGEFLYRAMISHRMASPFCMGSLYWQYNDIWNGTTWSVANSQSGWSLLKSSQGRVAEAMLPVVMSLEPIGWWGAAKDEFFVHLNSRLIVSCKVPLEITAYDALGQELFSKRMMVELGSQLEQIGMSIYSKPRGNDQVTGAEAFWAVHLISFAGKRKYRKKMDRVNYYSVRLRQPAAAQRLLDLIPQGKHYGEGYPVLEECISVGN